LSGHTKNMQPEIAARAFLPGNFCDCAYIYNATQPRAGSELPRYHINMVGIIVGGTVVTDADSLQLHVYPVVRNPGCPTELAATASSGGGALPPRVGGQNMGMEAPEKLLSFLTVHNGYQI
jgi:hypothetical protein